jgi:hypothetical protein
MGRYPFSARAKVEDSARRLQSMKPGVPGLKMPWRQETFIVNESAALFPLAKRKGYNPRLLRWGSHTDGPDAAGGCSCLCLADRLRTVASAAGLALCDNSRQSRRLKPIN